MYYVICQDCGARLDTGEKCDCKQQAKSKKGGKAK